MSDYTPVQVSPREDATAGTAAVSLEAAVAVLIKNALAKSVSEREEPTDQDYLTAAKAAISAARKEAFEEAITAASKLLAPDQTAADFGNAMIRAIRALAKEGK